MWSSEVNIAEEERGGEKITSEGRKAKNERQRHKDLTQRALRLDHGEHGEEAAGMLVLLE
jgi:hypothetical protein